MLALYRSGRQAEALEAYRNARLVLVEELGIEPNAALQSLEKSILIQDGDLDTPAYRGGPSGRAPPPLERKLVTVLFADLGMANELEEDPERTETFLAEVHREAEAEIEAAGGTVERGIAGALIATFGAPHARDEDHALRAVSAALATRKRLTAVFGETLWLRLSVESGEVILGRPGSFVTGMPVGAAARLIRSSAPGEILVGERAATTTCGAFELVERDGAYVLVGMLTPTRSPAQSARRRRRSRVLALATGALLIVAALATAAVVAAHAHHSPALVPPDSVGIIDPEKNKVVGHVPVGRRPEGVAVGANSVWVANLDDKTLSRIDPKSRTVADGPARRDPDRTRRWLRLGLGRTRPRRDACLGSHRIRRRRNDSSSPPAGRRQYAALAAASRSAPESVWAVFGDSSVFRHRPDVRRRRSHTMHCRELAFRDRVRQSGPSGSRTSATAV